MTVPRPAVSCCSKNFSAPNVKDPGLKEFRRYYYKYSSSTQEGSFKFCKHTNMMHARRTNVSHTIISTCMCRNSPWVFMVSKILILVSIKSLFPEPINVFLLQRAFCSWDKVNFWFFKVIFFLVSPRFHHWCPCKKETRLRWLSLIHSIYRTVISVTS